MMATVGAGAVMTTNGDLANPADSGGAIESTSTVSNKQPSLLERQKIALERYRNVIGYLQYENAIYWTRVGFFITAQAALVGFGGRLLFDALGKFDTLGFWFAGGICVLGLALCTIGLRTTKGSLRWIYRWQSILRKLEPDAYGEIEVFRGTENGLPGLSGYSVRDAANHVLYVFGVSWLGLLIVLAAKVCVGR